MCVFLDALIANVNYFDNVDLVIYQPGNVVKRFRETLATLMTRMQTLPDHRLLLIFIPLLTLFKYL
jgi:hypothetical protein